MLKDSLHRKGKISRLSNPPGSTYRGGFLAASVRGSIESPVLLHPATGDVTSKQAWAGFATAADNVASRSKAIAFKGHGFFRHSW